MIDLHTHTCFSDGADSPAVLLQKAQEIGLSVISITDHNTVAAYRTQAVREYRGRLIPGVEITCMYQGEVIEVLGYGFALEKMEAELSRHVLSFEEKQKREFALICAALQKAGAIFDPAKVVFDPKKESSRKAVLRQLRAEPSNRRLFSSDEAWESSRAFARQEIYNPASRLYVDQSSLYPDLQTAVQMIHRSGGLAFLAHLYIYAHAQEFRARLWEIVQRFGLDGVECAHSAFTPEQIADLERFCEEHQLLKCGGTDYHGSRKPDYALGTGQGQLRIPEEYLQGWNI
ncbi:PHP domain-containing protein [Symbiobacterium thermophilum]|uniref:Polymerase/histidinol phosphatase N-terminal domain-containing protein n=1 Tax=Symbiobacterium thermophilum TaxID=2734 RepID=A0A953I970_SYMTR|nr:PHP domain-containing protein [Symbiobacterium thermophilum]MBY6276344.1 hypothetical protein [Symbiobacterium thermophilum]